MKIVAMVRPGSACDYHRVFGPLRYLPLENGEKLSILNEGFDIRTTEFKGADIVVFNRYPIIELSTLLVLKSKFGFKIWLDIDDWWELYPEHYLYKNWTKLNITDKITKSIEKADIITVTNKRLLRKVLEINPKVKIVPNAVPIGHEQFRVEKTEATKVRFMYAGGPSHYNDLKTISWLFGAVAKSQFFHDETEFIMAGYNSKYVESALRNMNEIMSVAPNYSTRPGLPVDSYMKHYNYADVSLAPLEPNEFNTCKSNLKIIEAGCARMPIICQNMYPFLEDSDMKNKGIFYCNKIDDWWGACFTLANHPEKILEYGDNMYEYVRQNYDLLKINLLRREIIDSFK